MRKGLAHISRHVDIRSMWNPKTGKFSPLNCSSRKKQPPDKRKGAAATFTDIFVGNPATDNGVQRDCCNSKAQLFNLRQSLTYLGQVLQQGQSVRQNHNHLTVRA